ncbi:MAG: branched-chain amino acid ABC transporter substrate-binding protein [Anaerolineae bacterium]|jgi:branched-chain amino acid transport system substrate-binding protein|nr:MAG: branched-chain amino acid ABC transporter substrate-binding protein [Anaerolineae bacterium]
MKRRIFSRLLTLFVLVVVLAAVAVPVTAQDDTVIKIYASWPLTGGTQAIGESMQKAAGLALEHYLADNNGEGPAGFTVQIVFLDDASPTTGAWDGTIEAENAQRCVNDPQCMVYFGTYNSGAAKVSMPITNEAGIAQISPANTYAGLTHACETCEEGEPDIYRPSGEVNYFRTHGSDDVQGPGAASWAVCLGFEQVYVLDDTQAYGKGIADEFARHAEEIGLEVVGRSSVESTDIDFRALLTDVRASGATLVYGGFVMDSGGPQVIQQMDALGLFSSGIKFMGPDGLASASLFDQIGGAEIANDNVYLTFPGPLPSTLETEGGQRFYNDYVEQFDEEPDPYSVYAYQSMQVILDSIARAGVAERGAILEAMRNTTDFEGIASTFSFDENGDSTLAGFYGYRVVDGGFVEGTLVTPTTHENCPG